MTIKLLKDKVELNYRLRGNNLDLASAKARAKSAGLSTNFDSTELVDEAKEREVFIGAMAAREVKREAYTESDEGKFESAFIKSEREREREEREARKAEFRNPFKIVETNADKAFTKLINSYSIKGSYPQKQAAMDKAVERHSEEGAVVDLFNAAAESM